MAKIKSVASRPLSPHLTIYRPQISSVLSISHRLSGLFLYIGLLIVSWSLICGVFNDTSVSICYSAVISSFFKGCVGKVFIFLWSLALYYHFCNGIRHLIWDTGRLFSKNAVTVSGIITVVVSLILALFSWFYGFNVIIS